MRTKLVLVVAGAALVVGALFGLTATLIGLPDQPWCPEEDSCTPDYDGRTNSWVIHEDR